MIKLFGVGQINLENTKNILSKKAIDVILLPGIGDIIYSWYKLINYVNDGYLLNVKVLDCQPQRSHQLIGCLKGMNSFEYIGGFDYHDYWLNNIDDIRFPQLDCTFKNIPVLHINSFLETGHNIEEFMPNYKANYNIEINTNDDSKKWSEENINKEYYNIVLYTSNYNNNINCNVHPDPEYWTKLALLNYEFSGSEKPLFIYVIGASYDEDLTKDTFKNIQKLKIKSRLLLNENFYNIIELIRNINSVVTYESGFAMIADCFKIPLFHVIRQQGGVRDDKKFPFLGPINPDGLWNRYWPIFYDDTLEQIKNKLEGNLCKLSG